MVGRDVEFQVAKKEMKPGETVLEVKDLHAKDYRDVEILKGLNLKVRRGEIDVYKRQVLRSMWERAWSFIKKAGTIILLSTIVLWFLMNFGWVDVYKRQVQREEGTLLSTRHAAKTESSPCGGCICLSKSRCAGCGL